MSWPNKKLCTSFVYAVALNTKIITMMATATVQAKRGSESFSSFISLLAVSDYRML